MRTSTTRNPQKFPAPRTAVVGLLIGVGLLGIGAPAALSTTKQVSPAVGKVCKASDVGTPVSSVSGLITCKKTRGTYRWFRSTDAPTTVAPTSTVPSVQSSAPASIAASASTTVAPSTEKWPDKIIFAPVPAENAAAAIANWAPFVRALEKELGIKVEQVNPTDYAGVIEAQLSNKVDLAMYGPFSYYLATQAGAKIDPVAVIVSQIGTPAVYRSYLVAKADSSINSINDLKGKKVCFVDTASTSGYLYPLLGLKDAGLSEKEITPVFAGGHDRSVTSVKSGACDAGFAFDDMVDKTAIERGLIKAGEIKTVWKSKAIPQSPLAVRSDLPAGLVKKIKEVVPKIDTLYLQGNRMCTDKSAACTLPGGNSWVTVNNSFFDPIVEVCKATGAAACQPAKK
jgi:phosphonate transport system substrate-binding protein